MDFSSSFRTDLVPTNPQSHNDHCVVIKSSGSHSSQRHGRETQPRSSLFHSHHPYPITTTITQESPITPHTRTIQTPHRRITHITTTHESSKHHTHEPPIPPHTRTTHNTTHTNHPNTTQTNHPYHHHTRTTHITTTHEPPITPPHTSHP